MNTNNIYTWIEKYNAQIKLYYARANLWKNRIAATSLNTRAKMTKLDFKNKQYKLRNGDKYKFLSDELTTDKSILGLRYLANGSVIAVSHYPNGECYQNQPSDFDLVEVGPYDDFKIDDKVRAYNDPYYKKCGHFAGLSEKDKPMTFVEGGTSWTKYKWETEEWEFVEKAE